MKIRLYLEVANALSVRSLAVTVPNRACVALRAEAFYPEVMPAMLTARPQGCHILKPIGRLLLAGGTRSLALNDADLGRRLHPADRRISRRLPRLTPKCVLPTAT